MRDASEIIWFRRTRVSTASTFSPSPTKMAIESSWTGLIPSPPALLLSALLAYST
jgi:hypothetical protein